ncbi:hypothetical protein J6590_024230 [Homalodisca vitripennis]|nr:hypothetical protein J6590_024230 [Homalodisca vitripennis]
MDPFKILPPDFWVFEYPSIWRVQCLLTLALSLQDVPAFSGSSYLQPPASILAASGAPGPKEDLTSSRNGIL